MGRSVDYASNAHKVLYMHRDFECEDEFQCDYEWDEFMDDITNSLQEIAPSLSKRDEWESREVRIFLGNYLCNIAVSEYCGLVSLSFIPDEECIGIACYWIDQIMPKVEERFGYMLYNRVGTFSNGEGVYSKVKVEA